MNKKLTPWNKGRNVGPRLAITQDQVKEILKQFGARDLHDRCLFMTAVDSMLRCGDLLKIKVSDLTAQSGMVNDICHLRQTKTKKNVCILLSTESKTVCKEWIKYSQKNRNDFVFTRNKDAHGNPISSSCYRRLVKKWIAGIGVDPYLYSCHSLRRTRAVYLYHLGYEVEEISLLLGHKSKDTTLRYLGLDWEMLYQKVNSDLTIFL